VEFKRLLPAQKKYEINKIKKETRKLEKLVSVCIIPALAFFSEKYLYVEMECCAFRLKGSFYLQFFLKFYFSFLSIL
jgi:hypothetical protein